MINATARGAATARPTKKPGAAPGLALFSAFFGRDYSFSIAKP